jgi:hypothetical protein
VCNAFDVSTIRTSNIHVGAGRDYYVRAYNGFTADAYIELHFVKLFAALVAVRIGPIAACILSGGQMGFEASPKAAA